MDTETANEILPSKPTKAPIDPRRLKMLIIAPPKWGKTTLGCSAPDSILLAFEEGHMFHETHKIIIDVWKYAPGESGGTDDDGNTHLDMHTAVAAICASDRFQFVVIDTADMAAKMCLDYHYKKLGVNHASEAGDYGKGWDLCLTQPFRQQIGQLMKSGRGCLFITHTGVVTKKVGGVEISRQETTLPSQVQKFLHTQADLIVHGNFGKLRKGNRDRDRIISLDGTNEILAGSRVRGINMPKKYIVDPDDPWAQLESFFKDPKAAAKAEQQFHDLVVLGKDESLTTEETQTSSAAVVEPPKKERATTPAAKKTPNKRR